MKPAHYSSNWYRETVGLHYCPSAVFLVMFFWLILLGGPAWSEQKWPTPRLPVDLETYAIGEQITVNGMPMRLQGFKSPLPPQALVSALRQSLGRPLMEDRRGEQQVLGRAEGSYYITVLVEAAGTGSRGTVAITDLDGLARNREQQRSTIARWRDRLPAGSSVSSDMVSADAGKAAHHMVIANAHGAAYNRDALISLMASDGYVLERETGAEDVARGSLPYQSGEARTLHFKAPGKEALAVITRRGEKTTIILNTTTVLRGFK